MRWDKLFDDLESQLEQELASDEVDLRAEEERLRLGRISLRDRLLALERAQGSEATSSVKMLFAGDRMLEFRPLGFGRDWFSAELLETSGRRSQCIVPLAAVTGLVLSRAQVEQSLFALPETPQGAAGALSARLGLGYVLRDLCRRRSAIELRLLSGPTLHGTLDRVGRDHIDLALHEPGSPRRENQVSQYRVIPLSQLELVRL